MKGMGRVYAYVTLEMERQIVEAMEERFAISVLALYEDYRGKLLGGVPVIKDTIEKAHRHAEILAARPVGGERFSQISPTDPTNENRPGGENIS
ncbi:hypothetical protein EV645_0328 [Kribbella rubisoli]|uniref:Uncharacterized protein n=1 Tax=Kribbella rubisoli TaxID=3075929 RepID=A0A4Q7XKP3_9ACTN|nr:hypothetical protein [Kribbella rubisoli]RZU24367.1 hypothetical protein EV645_0328 [Kribbella rubisoli]